MVEDAPAGESMPNRVRGNEANVTPTRDRCIVAVVGSVLLVLGVTVATILFWPSADPNKIWQDAQDDLRAGRLDAVDRAVARLGRIRPPTVEDRMLRAQLAIARDRGDDAIEILDAIEDDAPLARQARLLAGQIALRRDRLKAAEEAFHEALKLDPGLSQARLELIYIYGYQSRSEDLSEQFAALAARGPLGYSRVLLWSLIRGVQWTPQEIVELLSKAVKADPTDGVSRIALADALITLNRFDEADATLAPLSIEDPDVRAARGRLALERNDVAALRGLIEQGPSRHAGLAMLRGKLALLERDPNSAVDAYRIALELIPNDRDALSGLAQALNQSGKTSEAAGIAERLNRVTTLANLIGVAGADRAEKGIDQLLALGEACEAIGLVGQARAWYQLALQLDPLDRRVQSAFDGLGDLEEARTDRL